MVAKIIRQTQLPELSAFVGPIGSGVIVVEVGAVEGVETLRDGTTLRRNWEE